MKSIKTKIVTGVVTVGLLSGVGAAFADTDAGTALQTWYNKQFTKSAASVATQTGFHAVGVINDGSKKYAGFKNDATSSINGTKSTSITNSNTAILAAKDKHITDLNNQKQVISDNMNNQFAAILNKAETDIDAVGVQSFNYAKSDLTSHTQKLGQDALQQVNDQLTTSKNTAKDELVNAIAAAKKELQTQLDNGTLKTVADINKYMDDKETAILALIQAKKDELVKIQTDLISAKALELENAAKAELQSVVNGI